METRINIWAWLRLKKQRVSYPIEILGTKEVRQDQDFPTLQVESLQCLLPQSELDWICENERQVKWIYSYLRENTDSPLRSLPSRLFGRSLIFAAIDIYNCRFEKKLRIVKEMENSWNEYVKEDVIFDWFSKKEKLSRCEAAWNWVAMHKEKDLRGIAPFSSIDDLIIFYDHLGLSKAEKELDISKIQSFWYQRESRAKNGDKKQYNFVLAKQAVADLDNLAQKNNLKRSQMLEVLIQNELISGSYAKKKGM